jgi:hypothetical protein
MADKQQVIRIVYKTDTTDLKKSEQAAQQAQQATDQLRNSAQKLGNDGAQSTQKYRVSIAFVKTEMERLKTLIELTARSDSKLLTERIAKYKILKAEVDAFNKSFNQQVNGIKQVQTGTKDLTSQFGQLYTAVKLFLTAGLIKQTVDIALNMAKLSGNVQGVERAFNRAFPDGQILMAQLTKATHGAVSEFELMQRTLQATNLGVAVESLPVLFEFAAARAQQTGESVDYLVDSIVRGIGRKSILVLDNLGLSATRLREQFNGASLASQSVADVTRGVAEIARVELEKMGGYAETTATKVDQLTVSWTRLSEELAKTLTQEGGTVDFLKSYVDTYANLFEAINKGITVSELAAQKRVEESAQNYVSAFSNDILTKSKEEQIEAIEEEIAILTKGVGSWMRFRDTMNENIESSKQQADSTFKVGQNMMFLQKNIDQDVAALERLRDANKDNIDVDVEVIKLLNARIAALKQVGKVQEQLGLIAAKEAEIKSVEEAIDAAKSEKQIHKLNIELADLNGQLADLKAFGTTKMFLNVNGELRLVPVIAPKNQSKVIPIEKGREGSKQLEKQVEDMIGEMRMVLPLPVEIKPVITPTSEWDKIKDAFVERQDDLYSSGLDSAAMFIQAQYDMEVDALNQRIRLVHDYYDEQQLAAGNNERFKQELRVKEEREVQKLERARDEREKRSALAGILVNTALGVIKAFATSATIYDAYVNAAIVAAEGLSQYAVASGARYYAKGDVNIDGPGTKTSDSIPAMISKGESVINADSTSRSLKLLEGINAGKIDDRILERLHVTGQGVRVVKTDYKELLDATKRNRPSDLVKIGSDVYEVRVAGDNFSKELKRRIVH